MNYETVYRKATGKKGLSANFTGKDMKKILDKETFGFELKNTFGKDIIVALMPGVLVDIDEIKKRYPEVQAILKDGDVLVDDKDEKQKLVLTCDGSGTMKTFQEFFKQVPGFIRSVDIISDKKSNFQQDIQFATPNPCKIEPLERIRLNKYLGTSQYDQYRVVANGLNLSLNAASLILLTIKADSALQVQLMLDTQY